MLCNFPNEEKSEFSHKLRGRSADTYDRASSSPSAAAAEGNMWMWGREKDEGGGGAAGLRVEATVGARSTNTRVCASPKTGKHSVSKWELNNNIKNWVVYRLPTMERFKLFLNFLEMF